VVKRAIERLPELYLLDVGSTKAWDLEDMSVDPPVRIEVKGSTQLVRPYVKRASSFS
jgi:hypothetical protein